MAGSEHTPGHDNIPSNDTIGGQRNSLGATGLGGQALLPEFRFLVHYLTNPRDNTPTRHITLTERPWAEGCRNAAQIHRELTASGIEIRYGRVAEYVQAHKSALPGPASLPPSVCTVAGWLTKDPTTLIEEVLSGRAAVLERCPQLAAAHRHIVAFATMMTTLPGDRLPQ